MRKVYFYFSGAFIFVGLIVCFENIQMAAPIMIGFDYMGTNSLFFPLLIILTIGIIGGIFAGMGIMSKGKKNSDDDDELDI